ncbi:hypothetical protein [Paracraurococcus lichenis]|uniref:Uncharacterized protein n=1 Tax=Paracraurococcus lichenis TaxID=3064888 RepID=A0ABT9EDB9_9PROT|nr:hypothetical protein [Paracraurococcus sp. LOR1-02]MDO9714204.1 hypothetical protein [Paracraurococcus sp. LOR1-02]
MHDISRCIEVDLGGRQARAVPIAGCATGMARRTTLMPRAPPAPCSGGQATALPKAGTGEVEMIRHLKVARDTAVKARTQARLALKAIILSAPAALREQLDAVAGEMATGPVFGGLPAGAADHDHRLS